MDVDKDTVRSRSTDAVFERGQTYRDEGRVQSLDRFGDVVTAAVRGSNLYDVTVELGGRSIETRVMSPLEEDEVVRVVGMIDEVTSEMFVEIEWMDRTFGVPLAQLEPIDPDKDTREAINDWHYWEGDGTRIR